MAKKLYRVKEGKTVAGVCNGLGEYFDIDPTIVRLAWIAFIFMFGGGLLAYLIAILVIPYKPDSL